MSGILSGLVGLFMGRKTELRKDSTEKKRAEWLAEHGAPENYVLLTLDEIKILKDDLESSHRQNNVLKRHIEKLSGRKMFPI